MTCKVSKSDLIHILRYAYLSDNFDNKFWDKLLEGSDHPGEASSIINKFNPTDIGFN